MALPLEANSLSSITQLAGNPPKYPRNPTQKKREPLVLYLARVPGKKDIILTTIKPRLKNVTAEDVMNSLYYLHLDLPSDALLLDEAQFDEESEQIPTIVGGRVAPKPLVRDSNAKVSELPTESSQQLRISSGGDRATRWQNLNLETTQSVSVDSRPPPPKRLAPTLEGSLVRRPLGPRPLIFQPQINREALLGDENTPIRSTASLQISTPGYTTRPPNCGRRNQYETHSDAQNCGPSMEFGSISDNSHNQNSSPFSITLIRRDPTSGAQWTIGKVKANPPSEFSSAKPQLMTVFERRCSSAMINLTTEGYCQFASPISDRTEGDGANQWKVLATSDKQFGFGRELQLSGSSLWKRKSREHRRGLSDQSAARRSLGTSNSNSLASLGAENEGLHQGNPGRTWEVPNCGFLSPWNGRCDFSSGNSGRRLKCKHTLPNSTSSNNISELRFNLPATAISGGTRKSLASELAGETKRFGIPKTGAKSSSFEESGKFRRRSQQPHPTSYAAMYPSSDDDTNDADDDVVAEGSILDDRIDPLGLGREKAGGGIRGRRVKLGKLIVYDEGLKMLDLVVAANMGVWWTIWDR